MNPNSKEVKLDELYLCIFVMDVACYSHIYLWVWFKAMSKHPDITCLSSS